MKHAATVLCPHFGECSGCTEVLSVNPPPAWEEVLTFFKDQMIPNLHPSSPFGWRHRAKVAVRGIPGAPLIGLFKRGSHVVSPIPFCQVHHPRLNQAFESIRLWMKQHEIGPYQEKTGRGDLRYLQGVVQRQSGLVQLTFVLNTSGKDTPKAHHWRTLLHQLAKEHKGLWHSLWLNFNDRSTNAILGPQWSHVWGEKWLWETLGEVLVCYGPANFGQANINLFESMLTRLRELIPEQARVAEFYAGVGVIGLSIASQCQWVRCSEMNPHAEVCFEQARSRLPLNHAAKMTFHTGSTQNTLSLMEEASTVIVDPPRKGLEASFFFSFEDRVYS